MAKVSKLGERCHLRCLVKIEDFAKELLFDCSNFIHVQLEAESILFGTSSPLVFAVELIITGIAVAGCYQTAIEFIACATEEL